MTVIGLKLSRRANAVSARNRMLGIVTRTTLDTVMAQVEMVCGPYRLVSLMSSEAARPKASTTQKSMNRLRSRWIMFTPLSCQNGSQGRGLWLSLDAYQGHVFWELREVSDATGVT